MRPTLLILLLCLQPQVLLAQCCLFNFGVNQQTRDPYYRRGGGSTLGRQQCRPGCPGNCGCGCGDHNVVVRGEPSKEPTPIDDQKKPTLWVFGKDTGCLPCIKFENHFNKSTVNGKKLNSIYIVKRYHLKDEADAKKYNIELTPTFRFEGKKDVVGYSGIPEDLLQQLADALAGIEPPDEIPQPKLSPAPAPPVEPVWYKGRDGKDGINGKDGKDAVVDYDKLANILKDKIPVVIDYQELAWHLSQQMPKNSPSYNDEQISEIVAQVIKRLPKQQIYYDIKPLPK